MNVAETIQDITRKHLTENHGLALGQCLTAVGWVAGTVPEMREEDGLVELATSDVSNGGIAVGLALAGRRPIYIVRYQGFQWFNAATIINYAAKSKEMWGIPSPVFVRSIGMEGGIGPVASNLHHGLYMRMPGIPICAPMTPNEYRSVWDYFMAHDDPIYVSEHRSSFKIDHEMENKIVPNADITLIAISAARLSAIEAEKKLTAEGITCNVIHLLWLKPLGLNDGLLRTISSSKYGGIVLDGDYANGAAKNIAYDIMMQTGTNMYPLGLEDRTAGFAPQHDNLPPSPEKICAYAKKIVSNRSHP